MKLAFYKGTGWVSKAIMKVSRGGYSHVAVVLSNGSIIEAHAKRGVCTRKDLLDEVDTNTTVDVFDVDTTPGQDIIIHQFLEEQIGKGYDYWNIVGFVIHATKEGRKGYDRWFCSELAFAAFQKAGINLLERVEAWKVSPVIASYSPLLKNRQKMQITKGKKFGLTKYPSSIRLSLEKVG